MLNSKVNFDFSIMKMLWDLAHEKLINIICRHGILNEYSKVENFKFPKKQQIKTITVKAELGGQQTIETFLPVNNKLQTKL